MPVLWGVSFDATPLSGVVVEFVKIAKIFHSRGYRVHLDLGYDIKADKNSFFRPYTDEAALLPAWVHLDRVEGIDTVAITDVHPFVNQTDALRFVAFVDRLYDAQVRLLASGTPLDQAFPSDMLAGGYRKKYLRAISRLIALTTGSGL